MNFKQVIILVLFSTLGTAFSTQSLDLENIRLNYKKAVSDKRVCKAMMESLSKDKESPVHIAYLGAFQMIWAKHNANPISKLKTFNKGKKNINDAIMLDSNNLEIRFIRLSVQKNIPSFLGYRKNIEEDKKFIQANNKNIKSVVLKKMIADLI